MRDATASWLRAGAAMASKRYFPGAHAGAKGGAGPALARAASCNFRASAGTGAWGRRMSQVSVDGQPAAGSRNLRQMWEAAQKGETKLNLGDLIKFGREADRKTLLMSAVFLQKELPIRIAKRVQELQSLPVSMYSTRSVRELAALYEDTFFCVLNHEPPNHSKSEEKFSDMLLDVREKHKLVQANIAAGFSEMLRTGVPKWALESQEIQDKLTRFYTGRIGVRLLIDQHLGLRRDAQDRSEQAMHKRGALQQAFVGCVQTQCCIRDVVEDAIADARDACKMHLKDYPTVVVEGRPDITAPYIPEHLYIMVFEILKNSCRATVELHGRASTSHTPMYGEELPPCRVTISGGSDCFVRICDRGGGIPPQSIGRCGDSRPL